MCESIGDYYTDVSGVHLYKPGLPIRDMPSYFCSVRVWYSLSRSIIFISALRASRFLPQMDTNIKIRANAITENTMIATVAAVIFASSSPSEILSLEF